MKSFAVELAYAALFVFTMTEFMDFVGAVIDVARKVMP